MSRPTQWSWSDESGPDLSEARSDAVQIESKFPPSRSDIGDRLRAAGFEPMPGGEDWNGWAYVGAPALVHQVLVSALEALHGQTWRDIEIYPN